MNVPTGLEYQISKSEVYQFLVHYKSHTYERGHRDAKLTQGGEIRRSYTAAKEGQRYPKTASKAYHSNETMHLAISSNGALNQDVLPFLER